MRGEPRLIRSSRPEDVASLPKQSLSATTRTTTKPAITMGTQHQHVLPNNKSRGPGVDLIPSGKVSKAVHKFSSPPPSLSHPPCTTSTTGTTSSPSLRTHEPSRKEEIQHQQEQHYRPTQRCVTPSPLSSPLVVHATYPSSSPPPRPTHHFFPSTRPTVGVDEPSPLTARKIVVHDSPVPSSRPQVIVDDDDDDGKPSTTRPVVGRTHPRTATSTQSSGVQQKERFHRPSRPHIIVDDDDDDGKPSTTRPVVGRTPPRTASSTHSSDVHQKKRFHSPTCTNDIPPTPPSVVVKQWNDEKKQATRIPVPPVVQIQGGRLQVRTQANAERRRVVQPTSRTPDTPSSKHNSQYSTSYATDDEESGVFDSLNESTEWLPGYNGASEIDTSYDSISFQCFEKQVAKSMNKHLKDDATTDDSMTSCTYDDYSNGGLSRLTDPSSKYREPEQNIYGTDQNSLIASDQSSYARRVRRRRSTGGTKNRPKNVTTRKEGRGRSKGPPKKVNCQRKKKKSKTTRTDPKRKNTSGTINLRRGGGDEASCSVRTENAWDRLEYTVEDLAFHLAKQNRQLHHRDTNFLSPMKSRILEQFKEKLPVLYGHVVTRINERNKEAGRRSINVGGGTTMINPAGEASTNRQGNPLEKSLPTTTKEIPSVDVKQLSNRDSTEAISSTEANIDGKVDLEQSNGKIQDTGDPQSPQPLAGDSRYQVEKELNAGVVEEDLKDICKDHVCSIPLASQSCTEDVPSKEKHNGAALTTESCHPASKDSKGNHVTIDPKDVREDHDIVRSGVDEPQEYDEMEDILHRCDGVTEEFDLDDMIENFLDSKIQMLKNKANAQKALENRRNRILTQIKQHRKAADAAKWNERPGFSRPPLQSLNEEPEAGLESVSQEENFAHESANMHGPRVVPLKPPNAAGSASNTQNRQSSRPLDRELRERSVSPTPTDPRRLNPSPEGRSRVPLKPPNAAGSASNTQNRSSSRPLDRELRERSVSPPHLNPSPDGRSRNTQRSVPHGQSARPVEREHKNKWATMRPHTETKLDRPPSRPTSQVVSRAVVRGPPPTTHRHQGGSPKKTSSSAASRQSWPIQRSLSNYSRGTYDSWSTYQESYQEWNDLESENSIIDRSSAVEKSFNSRHSSEQGWDNQELTLNDFLVSNTRDVVERVRVKRHVLVTSQSRNRSSSRSAKTGSGTSYVTEDSHLNLSSDVSYLIEDVEEQALLASFSDRDPGDESVDSGRRHEAVAAFFRDHSLPPFASPPVKKIVSYGDSEFSDYDESQDASGQEYLSNHSFPSPAERFNISISSRSTDFDASPVYHTIGRQTSPYLREANDGDGQTTVTSSLACQSGSPHNEGGGSVSSDFGVPFESDLVTFLTGGTRLEASTEKRRLRSKGKSSKSALPYHPGDSPGDKVLETLHESNYETNYESSSDSAMRDDKCTNKEDDSSSHQSALSAHAAAVKNRALASREKFRRIAAFSYEEDPSYSENDPPRCDDMQSTDTSLVPPQARIRALSPGFSDEGDPSNAKNNNSSYASDLEILTVFSPPSPESPIRDYHHRETGSETATAGEGSQQAHRQQYYNNVRRMHNEKKLYITTESSSGAQHGRAKTRGSPAFVVTRNSSEKKSPHRSLFNLDPANSSFDGIVQRQLADRFFLEGNGGGGSGGMEDTENKNVVIRKISPQSIAEFNDDLPQHSHQAPPKSFGTGGGAPVTLSRLMEDDEESDLVFVDDEDDDYVALAKEFLPSPDDYNAIALEASFRDLDLDYGGDVDDVGDGDVDDDDNFSDTEDGIVLNGRFEI